jgi:hypothetical protein
MAQEEARLLNHNYIGTEHLLLGLINDDGGIGARALRSLGVSLEEARAHVHEAVGYGSAHPSGHIPFTDRAKKVLEYSLREALQLGHNYIGTEHILLALIREGEGVAAQVLGRLGIDLNATRAAVMDLVADKADFVSQAMSAHVSFAPTDVAVAFDASDDAARCAFCGRDLWEAAHFVFGEAAAMCDRCISAAHDGLAKAPPDRQLVFLPVRITGDAPDDRSTDAITDVLTRVSHAASAAEILEHIAADASPDTLTTDIEQLLRRANTLPAATLRIDRVRFAGADSATVRVSHVSTETVSVQSVHDIAVVRRDGRWLLTPRAARVVLGR